MKAILLQIGTLIMAFIICILFNAGLVWLICWGLKTIGITSICEWQVNFSWALTILFTIVYWILKSIFKNNCSNY